MGKKRSEKDQTINKLNKTMTNGANCLESYINELGL